MATNLPKLTSSLNGRPSYVHNAKGSYDNVGCDFQQAKMQDTTVREILDAIWPRNDIKRLNGLLSKMPRSEPSALSAATGYPDLDATLHWAARHGQADAIRMLISYGAKPDRPNGFGQLPIHVACEYSHANAVETLLRAAPFTKEVTDAHDVLKCQRAGRHIPAPLPSRYDDLSHLKYCNTPPVDSPPTSPVTLNGDEDINVFALSYASAPVRWSSSSGSSTPTTTLPAQTGKTLRKFLNRNTRKQSVFGYIQAGETPLHYACRAGSAVCIQLLLRHGADFLRKGCQDESPILLAAATGRLSPLRALVAAGADVKVANYMGETALHLVAASASPEAPGCIKFLLESGAIIDAVDQNGETPAHRAASAGHVASLRLLIERGAPLVLNGINAANILDCACKPPNHDCLLYLLKLILQARHSMSHLRSNDTATLSETDKENLSSLPMAEEEQQLQLLQLFKTLSDVPQSKKKRKSQSTRLQLVLSRAPSLAEPVLDACAILCDDGRKKLRLDLGVFRAPNRLSEVELLLGLPHKAKQRVLVHPLSQTLLILKWRRVRGLFWLLASIHLVFLLVVGIHVSLAHGRPLGLNQDQLTDPIIFANDIARYMVLVCVLLILAVEILKLLRSGRRYMRCDGGAAEHVLTWVVILLTLVEVPSVLADDWQRVLSAVLVLLVCIQFLGILGRLPGIGVYVEMIQHVQKSLLPFFVAYFWLFLGFALAFHVLLFANDGITSPALSLLKALIMFVGEYNYPDSFQVENNPVVETAANILLALFVPSMTVLLLNLIIGIAVSDMQRLFQQAQYHRQVRLAQSVLYLEAMMPKSTTKFVTESVLSFKQTLTAVLDPFDPDGEVFLRIGSNDNFMEQQQSVVDVDDDRSTVTSEDSKNNIEEEVVRDELLLPIHVADGYRRLSERRWGGGNPSPQISLPITTPSHTLNPMYSSIPFSPAAVRKKPYQQQPAPAQKLINEHMRQHQVHDLWHEELENLSTAIHDNQHQHEEQLQALGKITEKSLGDIQNLKRDIQLIAEALGIRQVCTPTTVESTEISENDNSSANDTSVSGNEHTDGEGTQ